MSAVKISSDEPFVYSIFGLQVPENGDKQMKQALQQEFDSLITPHATHIDLLVQDGCATPDKGETMIWLAYWKSQSQYLDWWTNEKTTEFWSNLTSSSGMWREVMMPNASRTQYMTSKSEPIGLGMLGTKISVGDKTGYWGCYRHRMAAHSTDKFTSPVERDLCRYGLAQNTRSTDQPWRVYMNHFPDNVCFVVEGQDHSKITPEENKYWHDNLETACTQWMEALFTAEPESGLWGSRMCYAPDTGTYRNSTPKALNYNKKVQLFYFKDLRHMERMGRSNKPHVELRSRFMGAYGPGGVMSTTGKLGLWVETTVLKNGEIECEYVGCEEGTGWMALAGHQEFQS
ncbi:hypothetical protein PENSTE_c027G08515 [Penicillium steckii]|uniref:Uncharacterized protein n=1 Tax=Penicillium steckii TaxID=303698 RepID=A0A1V6SNQ1_9EURO|nr:hypothetical protein PENSTE_c027G08515 [Penicillium steckii]